MIRKMKEFTGIGIVTTCLMMTVTGCSFLTGNAKNDLQTETTTASEAEVKKEKASSMEYVIPKEDGLEVFTEEKQTKVKKEIDEKLENIAYTMEAPLIYYNPYGTNLRSANIYFTTNEPCKVTYTVSVQDKTIPDFTRNLETGDESGFTTEHAYQLLGLIPEMENTIELNVYNEKGEQVGTSSFTIDVPKVESDAEQRMAVTTVKEGTLTDGLFCVVYGRRDSKLLNIDLYDNDGILRGELLVEDYRTDKILFIDDYLYYSIAENKIAKVDRLGQVVKLYDLGQYTMHHDMVYDEANNSFIILANDEEQETVEDMIISLDLETGEVKALVDLKDILPEAYEKATLPDKKSKLDWAHVNAIQLIEDDVVLSFRELSSIVKIQDVYTKPQLQYILSDQSVWEGTSYADNVYDKIGDFTSQAGQHCITYVPGETEGEYELYMFNNNFTYSGTRKDIDWSGYTLSQVPVEQRKSYYYKYKINENEKTFKLVDSFEVPYSAYVSSVQKLDDNFIICSGSQKLFGEYDNEGNLLREYQQEKEQYVYRVFKYTFDGIWFTE